MMVFNLSSCSIKQLRVFVLNWSPSGHGSRRIISEIRVSRKIKTANHGSRKCPYKTLFLQSEIILCLTSKATATTQWNMYTYLWLLDTGFVFTESLWFIILSSFSSVLGEDTGAFPSNNAWSISVISKSSSSSLNMESSRSLLLTWSLLCESCDTEGLLCNLPIVFCRVTSDCGGRFFFVELTNKHKPK